LIVVVGASLRDVAVRTVADVNQVDAAQIRRAVVVTGFVGREFIGLSSRRTRLMRGETVGTDDVRHLVLVVQAVDRTQTCRTQHIPVACSRKIHAENDNAGVASEDAEKKTLMI